MAVVRHLNQPAEKWIPGGCPLTLMMQMDERDGTRVPVIKLHLVELDGKAFKMFAEVRSCACMLDFPLPSGDPYSLRTQSSLDCVLFNRQECCSSDGDFKMNLNNKRRFPSFE